MSITDELREFASTKVPYSYGNQISRIADRIDTEHERGMEERADRYSELRAKMNNCYVELPKDADGEYIHIGDMLEITHGFGTKDCGEVTDIHLQSGKCAVSIGFGDEEGVTAYPEDYRHHHAPTVEDLLDEFASAYDRIGGEDEEHQKYLNLIAEYAAKLRELVRVMYYCHLPWKDCDKCAMNDADMHVEIDEMEFCDGMNDLIRELGVVE